MLATAMVVAAAPATPASAQSLFEALFGGFDRGTRQGLPPRAYSYADPWGFYGERRYSAGSQRSGPSSGFCVRTCDGRFFPVKAAGSMSAADMCNSFCPAAKTKIFAGRAIDHAIAADGQRYMNLDNAFLYRERKVENCTCNGRDAYGLAPLRGADPTLRVGDIVATNDGLTTYNGKRSGAPELTPIAEAGGSEEWRLRLMSIKVVPAPPSAEAPQPPAEDKPVERRDRRRAQR